MVKVLEDGETKTYYMECQKCGSSVSYEFGDVKVEEKKIDFLKQYLVSKTVQCPKCGFENCVVMQTEEEFKEAKAFSSSFSSLCTDGNLKCLFK